MQQCQGVARIYSSHEIRDKAKAAFSQAGAYCQSPYPAWSCEDMHWESAMDDLVAQHSLPPQEEEPRTFSLF